MTFIRICRLASEKNLNVEVNPDHSHDMATILDIPTHRIRSGRFPRPHCVVDGRRLSVKSSTSSEPPPVEDFMDVPGPGK